MAIKVNDWGDLFARAEKDIVETMDSLGFHLYEYVDHTAYEAYRKECNAFWPVLDETGQPVKDTATGQEYEEDPTQLAYLLKSKIVKDGFKRNIKVWVDTAGLKNAEALARVGKLMEVYGCRPWSRLKSELSSAAKIKQAALKSSLRMRHLTFGSK